MVSLLVAGGASAELPTYEALAEHERPYAEIVAHGPQSEGSASVGTTLSGHLVRGVALPVEGPFHRVLPECRERGTNYGTKELIELIFDVSQETLGAAPGPRVTVCNLSHSGGGAMRWSQSHNSGRDADLAFFVTDLDTGAPVDTPGLVAFTGDGVAVDQEPRVRFDVPRNWLMVRALLTHPTVVVQWILVDRRLKRHLLAHARSVGEPAALLEQAEKVLHQPSDARRHNDHFHVRIFCAWDDRAEGCLDREPLWPWRHVDPLPLMRRTAALSYGLHDPDPKLRRAVLEHLIEMQGHGASPAMAEMAVLDANHTLRGKAATTLLAWHVRDAEVVDTLTRFIRAPGGGLLQDDPGFTRPATAAAPHPGANVAPWIIEPSDPRTAVHLHRAYKLLAKLATPYATPFVGEALGSSRVVGDEGEKGSLEARMAARVAIHIMDLALVPALIEHVTHPSARVRITVDLALRRITNHVMRGSLGQRASTKQLERKAERWRTWWNEHKDWSRDQMLSDGFKRRGHRFITLAHRDNIPRLVALTPRADEIGYNADRLLVRITRRVTPRGASAAEKHRRWLRWFPEADPAN
ncbi:MAG: penicillin-insensitive murein endopeptidase [Myxococcota bacterium]|nr:penicillin-insensitive murein endopeptidase [Myxococcota bacterium]